MVLIRSALAAATLACLTGVVSAQQAVFPPGARAGLVPPAGFAPASTFVGFENTALGGAIVVGDLPVGTFEKMLPTLGAEELARGGIRVSEPLRPWPIADGEGRIVRGQQESRGVEYRRWLVLARNKDTATLVSAMVPETVGNAKTQEIEAALRTIAFRPPPSLQEQIAALPFRVGDLADFRPVLATGGLSLLLTEGPQNDPPGASQPIVYLVVNQSGAQGGREANLAMARRLFDTTPTLRRIEATRSEDRGDLSRIEGRALVGTAGDEIDVIHLVRFENGGYQRAVGIFRRGEAERYRERFERLAASMAWR